ncbi:MAG: energy-coupling factor ABC transporter permease [Candidatus Bathyarchaeia archaeon]
MHIPDGFLDPPIFAATYAFALVFILLAFRGTRRSLGDRQLPLLSILTASVFAAQMLNFPIIGGTSGHLVGGTLIAVFLGPYAAIFSMTVILVIQALVFGDGGLTALGANLLNMGVIAAGTYYVYVGLRRLMSGERGAVAAVFAAAWLSVFLGALACGLEIGVSSAFQPVGGVAVTVPLMGFWHVFIGVGEAAITSAIYAYVSKTRPEILSLPKIGPLGGVPFGEMG